MNPVKTSLQSCDLTTLVAVCQELRRDWVPARIERVLQTDKHHLYLGLRTLTERGWLLLSWHPQAARLHASPAPPAEPDTFTFSQQLWHQLGHLALTDLRLSNPWERVVDLHFAPRPGEPAQWHLYLEVMGRYSNAILTHPDGTILTCAHQVSAQDSRVRPLQTGTLYQFPPALTQPLPRRDEPFEHWHQRLTLIPVPLSRALIQNYRGLSMKLVREMGQVLQIDPEINVSHITFPDWQKLWSVWQTWLEVLQAATFTPGLTPQGYTVLGWGITKSYATISELLQDYYHHHLGAQILQQQVQQLGQKLQNQHKKLQQKAQVFSEKLSQVTEAESYRTQADLLMAHLHQWTPGMRMIKLADFTTAEEITIPIHPEKNALQTAQDLYKKYQKLKRAKDTVLPLLKAVNTQISYLEQIETHVQQLELAPDANAPGILAEIYSELAQQGYDLKPASYRPSSRPKTIPFLTFTTPQGYPIYVGRNNRQNEALTFTYANDYDLWFHAQEIPGSHVILRLPPGISPSTADLHTTANIAAYYSRSRHSQQVPVIYTPAQYLQRIKGQPPGTVNYRHEQVIWGEPAQAPLQQLTWQYPQEQQPQEQPKQKTRTG
ncbi:fibronectin-binding A-like [Gloeomargarita lithophora Alchichica-D10]|uniref:Rqc2 homolog RqcH n=1 Tax=Gloeomargarita lithophora Alchichica-D10 TaxID=1188229 RepID=A0A1J0A957_9CYAN|nr:NFACT RNA binding domain-containing protein [Gloeomargarita lithophora]APB32472.1 fibronectin-binding A-like [Gloeomargarita lithophora Alchichica-D10]